MDPRSLKIAAIIIALELIGVVTYQLVGNAHAPFDRTRHVLTISFVPAESNEQMKGEYEPLRDYLRVELGMNVRITTSTDYSGVIEAMRRGDVDVARLGPLSYVLAEREADAEVFACELRNDGQTTYHGLIMVPFDSPIQDIDDLEGKTVGFVDPASTSGNLVPTYMVWKQTGQMPNEFFGKLRYLGSHDATLLAVRNQTIEAAVSNTFILEKLTRTGHVSPETNRIIATSPPIPGTPLVWRKSLDPALKDRVREAILKAHDHTDVSPMQRFQRYVATTPADYQIIRDMVDELKLQRSQLLE